MQIYDIVKKRKRNTSGLQFGTPYQVVVVDATVIVGDARLPLMDKSKPALAAVIELAGLGLALEAELTKAV